MLRRDPCIECGQPVFLAERLMVTSARLLFHRTCFRCARCNSQLTLANYYETEDGAFCCETCPDEERRSPPATPPATAPPATVPLATADESTSSSETSRPPSVAVDTNDLPSKNACESVHSISETEDYAKEQSLSLVQMRRRWFEKDGLSGQVHVSWAQMSTRGDGEPKTDEEKLSEAKISREYPSKVTEDVSKMDDSSSNDAKETSSGVSSRSAEVEDASSKVLDQRLESRIGVQDEKLESRVVEGKELEARDVGEKELDSRVVEEKEHESRVVKEKELESRVVEEKELESRVVEEKELESRVVEEKELESRVVEEKELESRVVEEKELESRVVEEKELESRVVEEKELESRVVEDREKLKEDKPSHSISNEQSEPKRTEDEPMISSEKEKNDDLPESPGDGDEEIETESSVEARTSSEDKHEEALLESRHENDEKRDGAGVEVKVELCEENRSQSREEDEEKNDREKKVGTVVSPPLPPAVDATPATSPAAVGSLKKPPVTPRKRSEASPIKSVPTVTRRAKSPARPESYPAELNPFSDDEEEEADKSAPKDGLKEVSKDESKDTSNPFGLDDEEQEVVIRKKERPPRPSKPPQRPFTHVGASSKMDDIATSTPKDTRRPIPVHPSLNPFWDDGEEPDDDEDEKPQSDSAQTTPQKPPVPKPRTVISVAPDFSPFSDRSTLSRSSGRFGSANSLSSVVSSASTMRRKKHAAPPPPVNAPNSSLSPRAHSLTPSAISVPSSPTLSSGQSTLGRSRKSRPAPKPPGAASAASNRSTWNPSTHYQPPSAETPKSALLADEWQEGKFSKDEINRSKQNQLSAAYTGDLAEEPAEEHAEDASFHSGDKSSHGQWKRKKGPAPPRPIPQRRQIRSIPLKELKRELDDIEVLQLELERQGVKLETTIRKKFDEIPDASESSMTPDIEDLVLQLFELVNEKNELFRKQAELMYLRRQQRLEEEHADLEYQIRVLMDQPERNKTDSDKAKEEKLIQRLVEVVERRNEIVECLETDRLREAEEDHSIHSRLELFASKSLALNDAYINDLYKSTPALTCCARKEKKKKKDKTKKGTLKFHKKEKRVDADKDIDETEVEPTTKEKKTKRKWF